MKGLPDIQILVFGGVVSFKLQVFDGQVNLFFQPMIQIKGGTV